MLLRAGHHGQFVAWREHSKGAFQLTTRGPFKGLLRVGLSVDKRSSGSFLSQGSEFSESFEFKKIFVILLVVMVVLVYSTAST